MNANTSNENRNKTRRENDITMAGTYNNRILSKLTNSLIEEMVY